MSGYASVWARSAILVQFLLGARKVPQQSMDRGVWALPFNFPKSILMDPSIGPFAEARGGR